MQTLWRWLLSCAVLAICGRMAAAHEVDQHSVPVGEQFVDHGDYWNRLLFQAVAGALVATNDDITRARRVKLAPLRAARLAHLHAPATFTWRVRKNLPTALWAIESLEMQMRLARHRDEATGRLLGYRAPLIDSTYSHPPGLPDVRQLNRMLLMRCSTIKVHGQYLGTDKIGHFLAMGYLYYQVYRAARLSGQSQEDALGLSVQVNRWGPLSEQMFLGMIPTGVYSNADMAANYVGMKYYVNVTEPVKLQGRLYPAMVQRVGDYWRLSPHVRPDGDFFAAFVSEHFDEVLNPSLFVRGTRGRVRRAIQRQGTQLVHWYAQDRRAAWTPHYYEKVARDCRTYYGEPYGHAGQSEQLVTVA
ncbi:MAG: hypothetical protein GTO03_00360, partial [Planctomycetales bacterium]|nr:hypothetical protein [Planctomycetales bacterium]